MLNAPKNIDSPKTGSKHLTKRGIVPTWRQTWLSNSEHHLWDLFSTCLFARVSSVLFSDQPTMSTTRGPETLPIILPHGPLVQSLLRSTRIFNIWLWLKTRGSTKMNLPISEYDPSFLVSLCLPSFCSYFWQSWPHLHGVALDFELERRFHRNICIYQVHLSASFLFSSSRLPDLKKRNGLYCYISHVLKLTYWIFNACKTGMQSVDVVNHIIEILLCASKVNERNVFWSAPHSDGRLSPQNVRR